MTRPAILLALALACAPLSERGVTPANARVRYQPPMIARYIDYCPEHPEIRVRWLPWQSARDWARFSGNVLRRHRGMCINSSFGDTQ